MELQDNGLDNDDVKKLELTLEIEKWLEKRMEPFLLSFIRDNQQSSPCPNPYCRPVVLPLPQNVDWDRLRIFYYVAKIGNLMGAKQHLKISQPALSRCLQILESQLGKKLFIRASSAQKLTLTRAGQIVMNTVSQCFDHFEKLGVRIQEDEERAEKRGWDNTFNNSPYQSGSDVILME